MKTNFGPLSVLINPRTGRAEVARGGPSVSTPAPAPSAYKSKLEHAFSRHLDALKLAGDIDGWRYEPVNFRLPGKKNFYRPDFCVWKGWTIIFYDTKGRNKSDDRSLVKIKTAAGLNPWATFYQVRRVKGVWDERGIG